MHTFYEMIQIMENDRPLEEDWKKWALPVAVAAGSLASAYRAVNYPTNPSSDRPAAVSRETDDAPRKGDARYQKILRNLGVARANDDLATRQGQYNLKKNGGASESEREQMNDLGIGGFGGNMPRGGGAGYPKTSVTSPDAGDFF